MKLTTPVNTTIPELTWWRGVRGFLWSNQFLNHVRDCEDGVKSRVKPIFHTWYAEQSGTPVNLASGFLHLKLIAMSSDFHFSRPSQHCVLLASVLCAEWARIPCVEILPRSLLELWTTSFYSPSLSLSLSSFATHKRSPHSEHAINKSKPGRSHSVSARYITKDAKRFLVYGRCAFSHRYLPDLLVKQQSYGVASMYHGGAFQLLLQNLSTCVRNFTCRRKEMFISR